MSMGQYLADKGLISQNMLDDSIAINPGYYQTGNNVFLNYMNNAASMYFSDINPEAGFHNEYIPMSNQYHVNNTRKFGGPSLSFAKQRKYWKEALASKESVSICGDGIRNTFYRKKL